MENASKALIIAGAILLSILIIGLGMFIYRQAAGVMNNTGLDELAVEQHNSEYTQYEGTKVSGTQVKALVKKIEANNRAHADDESLRISIESNVTGLEIDASADPTTGESMASKIKSGFNYKVECKYDQSSNYVNKVIITKNAS